MAIDFNGNKTGSLRGFAAMDINKQREIAKKGGKAVPNEKRSFSQDPSLAAKAGRKGGQSVPPEKRSFSQDPDLAAAAGRKGGLVSGSNRTKNVADKNVAANDNDNKE